MDAAGSAIAAMRALRHEIEARLLATEDYRALKALDKAIKEIAPPARAESALAQQFVAKPALSQSPSQADATAMVLEEQGRPLSSQELVPLIRAKGADIGGERPGVNLTSSLSRAGRFRSMKINGAYRWWFRDRPYHGEQLGDFLGEQAGGGAPAADEHHGEGSHAAP